MPIDSEAEGLELWNQASKLYEANRPDHTGGVKIGALVVSKDGDGTVHVSVEDKLGDGEDQSALGMYVKLGNLGVVEDCSIEGVGASGGSFRREIRGSRIGGFLVQVRDALETEVVAAEIAKHSKIE